MLLKAFPGCQSLSLLPSATALLAGASMTPVLCACRHLGFDMRMDKDLLHIVDEAMHGPAPEGWEVHKDDRDEPFYIETATGAKTYEHFVDVVTKRRYWDAKAVKAHK